MWCVIRITLVVWHVVTHPRQGNHCGYSYGTCSRVSNGRVVFLILRVGFVFDQMVFERRDQFSTLPVSETLILLFIYCGERWYCLLDHFFGGMGESAVGPARTAAFQGQVATHVHLVLRVLCVIGAILELPTAVLTDKVEQAGNDLFDRLQCLGALFPRRH